MRHLTLDAIYTIDTIARTGSFSAAAEALHKVPSTISYTVSKLEEQVGLRFFERNGPRVTLTPVGHELLNEGRNLLILANDLELRLQKMVQGVELELSIALDELLPLAAFTEDIKTFNISPHRTRLNFQHETLTGTWEALMQRRADLVVAAGHGPAGGGYKTYPIGSLSFAFCVAPNHPLTKTEQPLRKHDLLSHTAIVVTDSARHFFKRTTGLFAGQPQLTVNTLADKIGLQKAGLGHGFLPKACIADELKRGTLIELEVAERKDDEVFYLAWRTGEDGAALAWWRQRLSHQWLQQAVALYSPRGGSR